jgi:hypothetical protein
MFLGAGYHPRIPDCGSGELWFHIPHNALQLSDAVFNLFVLIVNLQCKFFVSVACGVDCSMS